MRHLDRIIPFILLLLVAATASAQVQVRGQQSTERVLRPQLQETEAQEPSVAQEEDCALLNGEISDGECPLERTIRFQESRARPVGTPQRIIIEAVDFEGDSVLVRNVSDEPLSFAPSPAIRNAPWRMAAGSSSTRLRLPGDFTLPPQGRVGIHLRTSGDDDAENIYLDAGNRRDADLRPDRESGQEVAILSPYG